MSRKRFIKFLVHATLILMASIFAPKALIPTILMVIWGNTLEIAINTSNMRTATTAKEFEEMSNKYEVRLNKIRRGL